MRLIFAMIALPSCIASIIVLKLSSSRIMSPASLAIEDPEPIAMPM